MSEVKYSYQPNDFKSDQEVKWCPGCGDYSILNAVQRAMPEVAEALNIPHERFAVVSGIGCSSRFPYYVNTYGFHGIHGRAAAIATGLKVANPKLSVWVASGDGDSLAIGGNHFIHTVRRNVDLSLMIFNNEIYGLTKGQYSPTSQLGTKTKTSPHGTVEQPFNPGELTIGARGTFFARSIDVELNLTKECLSEGAQHAGTAVVEVLQNCVIFNDKTFSAFTDKEYRADRTITLRHGEKMLFGKDRNKGLVLDGMALKVVTLGENGVTEKNILTHDATTENPGLHLMLASMCYPEFPVALGVIRRVATPSYDIQVEEQIAEIQSTRKICNVDDLLHSGQTWEVK